MNIQFPLLIHGPHNTYKSTIALKVAYEYALSHSDKPTEIYIYSDEISVDVIPHIFTNYLSEIIPDGFNESIKRNRISFFVNEDIDSSHLNKRHRLVILDELYDNSFFNTSYSDTETLNEVMEKQLLIRARVSKYVNTLIEKDVKVIAVLARIIGTYKQLITSNRSATMLSFPSVIETDALGRLPSLGSVRVSDLITKSQ